MYRTHLDIPLPAVRACRVRLGLSGIVLSDRFEYYCGWHLRLFKEVLLGVFGPLRRFDIVRGTEKWTSYTHYHAAEFLDGSPGEEIQLIFLPHPDSVMTDPAVTDENVHWEQMWSAIAKDSNYILLENGDSCNVPGHGGHLYIVTCTLCGAMGLYSYLKNSIKGIDAAGCPIFHNSFKHQYTHLGRRLSFCEQCQDAELPGLQLGAGARRQA